MTSQCIDCLKIWNISKHADNHMYVCPACTVKHKKKKNSRSQAREPGALQEMPAPKKHHSNFTKKQKKRKEAAI
jgi:hypothetical protein